MISAFLNYRVEVIEEKTDVFGGTRDQKSRSLLKKKSSLREENTRNLFTNWKFHFIYYENPNRQTLY